MVDESKEHENKTGRERQHNTAEAEIKDLSRNQSNRNDTAESRMAV